MSQPVILAARRTPIGRFLGGLSRVAAPQLGAWAIGDALADSGASPADVDECIMGCVLQAGIGQNPARQAGLKAGCPDTLNAVTINKVCGSGLQAVMQASQSIRAGDNSLVVAGGMENMSASPHLASVRGGLKFGAGQLVDHMEHDGLTCAFEGWGMGSAAEWIAETFDVSRDDQDAFAAASHQKAAAATREGRFANEITTVSAADAKQKADVDADEGIRGDSSADGLAKLRPVFAREGSVTAGNASQISDGGAALVVASTDRAAELGSEPMARIVDAHTQGVPPKEIFTAPALGVAAMLERNGLGVDDVDCYELNEAFAAQALQNMRALGVDEERVNDWGGAIAVGHPIGASGARVLVTLVHRMQHVDAKRGVASLCLGGGNAVSMLIERD